MGQRLNLEIVDGDKVLANAYYHWSGYTVSALKILKMVVEKYKSAESIGGVKLAVEILAETGAGFNEKEVENIKKNPEFAGIELQPAIDRNAGLLSITEEGISETQEWAEETVVFDIGTGEVVFGVYIEYDKDCYIDLYSEEEYDALPELDSDLILHKIKYYDIDKLEDLIFDYQDGFRDHDGYVISWIA